VAAKAELIRLLHRVQEINKIENGKHAGVDKGSTRPSELEKEPAKHTEDEVEIETQ